MKKLELKTPGLGGAQAPFKNAAVGDGDKTNSTTGADLRTTCSHSLITLAQARRHRRDISPELPDALDALSVAVEVR